MSATSPNSLKARFIRLVQWTVFVLGLSTVFHLVIMAAIPNVTFMSTSGLVAKQGGLNQALHLDGKIDNKVNNALAGSPANLDLLTSVCAFNLATGPLVLSAKVPDRLWTLSIYDDNSQLVHLIDEKAIPNGKLLTVLSGNGQQYAKPDKMTEIRISRFTGLVVFRTLVDRQDNLEAQTRKAHTARCDAFDDFTSSRAR